MGNQTDTKKETKRKPTRGVRCWTRTDRPSKPYCVQWRVGKKKPIVSFAVKEDRDRRARELENEAKAQRLGEVPTRDEMAEFRAFKRTIGDVDWRDVVDAWRRSGSVSSLKAEDMHAAYEQWQFERFKAKKVSAGVMKRQVKLTKAFAGDHQGRKAKDLTKEGLIDWIETRNDYDPAPTTFNRALSVLRAMWDRSKEPDNLFQEIETREEGDASETIRVLPIKDAELLFGYGLENMPWVMPRIALEAFMGARFRTAALFKQELVNVEEKGITFTSDIIKTKKRQYLEAIEPNLWSWMALATPQTWSLTERQYLTMKSRLFNDSGVPHPHNCLRHSAASYHVAAFQNPGKTALLLCHKGQQRLWDNYKGVATKADGLQYFDITVKMISGKIASGEIKLPKKTHAAASP